MLEIKTPILPEGINEGKVIAIHCALGERVEAQQCLFEIETEKVILEVVAPQEGAVHSLNVALNEHVVTEQLLANIDIDNNSYHEDVEQVQQEIKDAEPKSEAQTHTPAAHQSVSERQPKVHVKKRKRWLVVAGLLFAILCLLLLI